MDSFENNHDQHITGSLAMFDRMIFTGHLSHLFKPDAVRALLWARAIRSPSSPPTPPLRVVATT